MKDVILKQQKRKNSNLLTERGKRYASKEEVVATLGDAYATADDFHDRLLYFALNKIRMYSGMNSNHSVAAEDVVQDVLTSIIELRRKWYRDTVPDFHKFVRLAILSHIRNEYKKKQNLKTTELFDEDGNLGQESVQVILREYVRQDTAEMDFRENVDVILRQCKDQLKDDDDVCAAFVLEEICNGMTSNIKIAETLGVRVRDVENAKKRIKNRFRRLVCPKTSR